MQIQKSISTRSMLMLLLILTAFSQISTAMSAGQRVHYYAGISGVISPFLEYHPVLPITASEAKNLSHFRVTKDSAGRLMEMAWFADGQASNSSYFGTHKVTYAYRGKGAYSRRYFDAQDKPATMWRHYYEGGDIHEERYDGDGDNRTVALFNQQGEKIESSVGAHRFTAQTLDERRYLQTQINLAGEAVPFRTAMPFMAVIVSVDGDGYLDKVLNVAAHSLQPLFDNAAGYAAIKVNFDENGLELGWEYQDEKGSLVNLPLSDPHEPGAAFTVYFKQWHNQRLNQWQQLWGRYYDKTGAVIADKRGVHLVHYRRDAHLRIAEIAYYGANGQLHFVAEDGFARKAFHYPVDNAADNTADKNARIEKRFDANNQLIP